MTTGTGLFTLSLSQLQPHLTSVARATCTSVMQTVGLPVQHCYVYKLVLLSVASAMRITL